MRLPKRGEKGFTLIELLIVVAILGVLAAVVIPNVTRFVGSGEEEAAETELHNIQLAVTSMMLENGLTEIPAPSGSASGAVPLNSMTSFPDSTSNDSVPAPDGGKVNDPDGVEYDFSLPAPGDKAGYVLYGHDMKAGDGEADVVNYVVASTTALYYTCDVDGTVKQWSTGDALP